MSHLGIAKVYLTIGKLLDDLPGTNFWDGLADLIHSVAEVDELAVFHYVRSEVPRRVFDLHPKPARDRLHSDLLKAAYLIGPYYNTLVKAQANDGYYHIDQITPDSFRASEYHRIYYREKKVSDEGMYYVKLNSSRSMGVLVERVRPSPPFDKSTLGDQRALQPLISALVRLRWQMIGTRVTQGQVVNVQMATALENFGHDILSYRERQIAELILRGHSSKSGARELGISSETERVHRKRLYSKLGISSQSELFWMFIQAVGYFNPEEQNDPLSAWFKHKAQQGAPVSD